MHLNCNPQDSKKTPVRVFANDANTHSSCPTPGIIPDVARPFDQEPSSLLVAGHGDTSRTDQTGETAKYKAVIDSYAIPFNSISLSQTIAPRAELGLQVGSTRLSDRFEILAELGSGASATVFRAFDHRLHREVAVKVFHQLPGGNWSALNRHLEEARSLAQLSHSGIVQIYEIGDDFSTPYIVAELVDGPTLAEFMRSGSANSFHLTASLVSEIANALSYAHRSGIVHRDLKPSNILLVRRFAENQTSSNCEKAAWSVKLADFGLACELDATSAIDSSDLIGTPSYMSPEAASGGGSPLDERSDLFSLGIVLYQLLTGSLPFTGRVPAVFDQIRNQAIVSPRSINAAIPRELEAICVKCLQKDPEARYVNAVALQDDLERWLSGSCISVYEYSFAERAVKWGRCNRTSVIAGAAIVLMLCVTLGFLWNSRQNARASAAAMVQAIFSGSDEELPSTLDAARRHRGAVSHSAELLRGTALPIAHRARLLLIREPADLSEARFLAEYMLARASAREYDLILRQLDPFAENVRPLFEAKSSNAECDLDHIRASIALWYWARDDAERRIYASKIAQRLCRPTQTNQIFSWVALLRALREELIREIEKSHLASIPRQMLTPDSCHLAVELCRGDAKLLGSLLSIAEDEEFVRVCDAMAAIPGPSLVELRALAEKARRASTDLSSNSQVSQEFRVEEQWDHCSRIVAAMLRSGAIRDAWIEIHRDVDPRLEAYLIDRVSRRELSMLSFLEALDRATDPRLLRTAILAIGQFPSPELRSNARLNSWLRREFSTHPSSGVHQAIRWLLLKIGERAWIEETEARLVGPPSTARDWFVNSLGITMLIIGPDPANSRNGANSSNSDRYYAISADEVTWGKFSLICPDFKDPSGGEKHPSQATVNWVGPKDALLFCVRLSAAERLDQAVVEVGRELGLEESEIGASRTAGRNMGAREWMFEIDVNAPGYRLPTLGELENASRAGCETPFSFGTATSRYAAAYARVDRTPYPSSDGHYLPNQWGFSHTIGNYEEWTLEAINENSVARDRICINRKSQLAAYGGNSESILAGIQRRPVVFSSASHGQSGNSFRLAATIARLPE